MSCHFSMNFGKVSLDRVI